MHYAKCGSPSGDTEDVVQHDPGDAVSSPELSRYVQNLQAENQWLREALTKIEDVNLPSGYEGDWHDAYEGARFVAREALAGDAE
jgi:hypothetical protein